MSSGCPRLIEVALPIREVSAESVRQKSAQRGHISTLHMWWARRPLAASRAVVFASLVPDPDDQRCPPEFRTEVTKRLRDDLPVDLRYVRRGRESVRDDDPYLPYGGMEDTPRNRLLMFIARWSREYLEFDAGRTNKEPKTRDILDDRSLVKWETSDPDNAQGRAVLDIARGLVRAASGDHVPTVLDPFGGGGAIPIEVGRLGCVAVANDYNPVAHLVLRTTCEFLQIYGKPGHRTRIVEGFGKEVSCEVEVKNMLSADLDYWARWMLHRVRERVGHLFPAGKDGRPTLAYLWARTAPCSNPSCRAEIPLLRSLVLHSKGTKVALAFETDEATRAVKFGLSRGTAIRRTNGTKQQRGPVTCIFCREDTSEDDLRAAATQGVMGERMVAVVVEGPQGKDYRAVEETDLKAVAAAAAIAVSSPAEYIVPEINGPSASPDAGSHRSINLELYGITRWGQLFNHRQLVVMGEFIRALHEVAIKLEDSAHDSGYRRAILAYLGLWIDRIGAFGNTVCRWRPSEDCAASPFSGQSIPMMWDYPEISPFGTGSGTPLTQLAFMLKVLEREQVAGYSYMQPRVLLGSATNLPLEDESCDCIVTDPPYGNSIAYADLSDFFYVWLKRSLGDYFPEVFGTPQTPKEQEATSHKHRHEGSRQRANAYYHDLLTRSFGECKRVAKAPKLVSVMFAHQSTEAWQALMSSLFDAGLCPDATWPIATERPNAMLGLGGANLESSVTVVCRPRSAAGAESFKSVKKEIHKAVADAVHRFWSYGFRGADLIVASYGPAVGVFGKYERVERGDGTPVEVSELLDFARQAARDAIAGEFRGDNVSTLYYVWANLYGAAEQSWDDARLVVQIGGDDENAMEVARGQGIFVVDGPKCRLAVLADREARRGLGLDPNAPLIDTLHRAMLLWKAEQRSALVKHLTERGLIEETRFWKLAQALFEVLPRDKEDWKLVSTLLGERETLRTEAKRIGISALQSELGFGKTEVGAK